jgi:adenylate cyclase
VQGLSYYRQAVTRENYDRAMPHWRQALALDPTSAALNSSLAFLHYADARFGWWDDRDTAVGLARAYIDRALELEPENPEARARLGQVLLLQERWDEAAAAVRRAVRLAPNSADIASMGCFVLATAGYPEEGLKEDERALTLAPRPVGHYFGHLGNAYRLAGRDAEAIAAFAAYDALSPGFGLADLVIIHQEAGRQDEARRTATRLLAARRDFTVGAWAETQFRRDPERLAADVAALRAARLPEG